MKKPAWTFRNTTLAQSSGQIVVEYVLLLVVGVSLAALITNTVASRNQENPGFLVRKWIDMIKLIGEDTADDVKDPTQ